MAKFDFSGWATRNNLKCSDGRTIMRDAFKNNDGQVVPLVWNHQHNDPENILGHALLENRDEGVYVYGTFNNTPAGSNARLLVEHGDVSSLSIYANKLKQKGGNVLHGEIKEVSLVLAPANPGAYIDAVIAHGEDTFEEATIYPGKEACELYHSCKEDETKKKIEHSDDSTETKKEEEKGMENKDKTVKDVLDTLTEEQKTVVYALIGKAMEDASGEGEEGEEMKHNLFENENFTQEDVLCHADVVSIFNDAKRYGSLKESVLAHAQDYGIENIDFLFPDAQTITNTPEFISREMDWVQKVIGSVHHTPFSRIKSLFANITEDEARAKGYIKGKLKKEEVFSLLKRTTTPTTIYKKQKLDRDDVVDITDFDVVAWLKAEMRMMLDEEIARAILVGDGRLSSSDDKINEQNIRPIWKDAELYTVRATIEVNESTTDDDKARAFIKNAVKARKKYKGTGNPILYTTEDMVTDCLLLENGIGERLYKTEAELATAMRVSGIITVPVMEGLTRRDDDSNTLELGGIIVNLNDYNVGADKGGAVNMFDDFDIDYNAQKYLIETRCSGALTKPYSAIAIEFKTAQQ